MDDDELEDFEISLRSEEALHETSYSSAVNYYDENSATVVHRLDSAFDIFLGWLKQPRFHLIIIPQKDQMLPDQKNKSGNIEAEIRKIQTRLKDPEYSIMKSDLKGIFLLFIDSKAELLQDYREHKFTFLKTEYRLLIHNSIEPRKKAYKGPNYYAREHFNLN